MNFPGTLRQPGFLDLLADAAFHYRLAQGLPTYEQNRHARSSIIASAFSIECCANCLLDDLEVSSSLYADLERLPTVSKFEAITELLGRRACFDRGSREVQIVRELVQARNDFVHPKVSSIEAEIGDLEDQGEHFAWPIHFLPGQRDATQLPKAALFWSADNAATAFHGVTDFYRRLLVDWLQFETDKVRSLFVPRAEATIGESRVVMETYFKEYEEEFQQLAINGLDLSFLGIGTTKIS